ncbi:MAG: hypothetical protein GX548_12095 [Lentisphaerae bacterium]|nr:hypothetical protein [Lentisphaerota bacterium]
MSQASRASWSRTRSSLEHGVEGVLGRLSGEPRRPSRARVVVLGGGTGLSTVLGGNASLPSWADRPGAGLASEFQRVSVGVCTTDDGGSTGELVRRLPMIGIGDLRKVMLSMIDRAELVRRHGPDAPALEIVQKVFLHRFGDRAPDRTALRDPVRVLGPSLRKACPVALRRALAGIGRGASPWLLDALRVPGHCLGNLLLAMAVFRGIRSPRAPTTAELERGLTAAAEAIGAPGGRVHAATSAPGTLIYAYANGVVATGQARAARARRGCAVDRVRISFAAAPKAHPKLLERLRRADLIVYAPGSLYSSMLPVLLVPGVVEAIRSNRRAVKILGANLWIQEGETDMSFREESRGFWVSELIEGYGRNVPGGIAGLFDVVLATSLDTVPGSIIRNYALEDKHPIHLDRARVAALGVMPVEASLFSSDRWERDSMIHHDPARALGLRADGGDPRSDGPETDAGGAAAGPRGFPVGASGRAPRASGVFRRGADGAGRAVEAEPRVGQRAGLLRSRHEADHAARARAEDAAGAEGELRGGAGRIAAGALRRGKALAGPLRRVPDLRDPAAARIRTGMFFFAARLADLPEGRADGAALGREPMVRAARGEGNRLPAVRHPVRPDVRVVSRRRLRARAGFRDANAAVAGLPPAALPGAGARGPSRAGPLLPRRNFPERLTPAAHCLLSSSGPPGISSRAWFLPFHPRSARWRKAAISGWWSATAGNSSSARGFRASS